MSKQPPTLTFSESLHSLRLQPTLCFASRFHFVSIFDVPFTGYGSLNVTLLPYEKEALPPYH